HPGAQGMDRAAAISLCRHRDRAAARRRETPVADGGGILMAATPDLTARRFRGFLPVVVDVETGGFQPRTDALLEIAAVIIDIGPDGRVRRGPTHGCRVMPFVGARLDPASLAVSGIGPWHPLRRAIDEAEALQRLFREI